MTQSAVVDRAVELVEQMCVRFEGVYLKPYLCPAGIPTIGIGCTRYEDGRVVTLNDPPITRDRAFAMFRHRVRTEFMPATLALCPSLGDDAPRLAAICDFAFNLGVGRLKTSTLRRKIEAGRWNEVPTELMKWNKGGGKVLRGLTARRQAEVALGNWCLQP